MNKPLLRKVIAVIEAEPRRIRMESWYSSQLSKQEVPRCGTVGCIAGWALLLDARHKPESYAATMKRVKARNYESTYTYHEQAAKVVGLSVARSYRLFFTYGWPEHLFAAYHVAKTPAERACAVVRRIKHFMRTGE